MKYELTITKWSLLLSDEIEIKEEFLARTVFGMFNTFSCQ